MPREWDLNRRIVIRKLPENATKGEIADLFGKFGKINNIFIARNPPGFAFLEYKRRRDAELAKTKGNGKRCCGFTVSVELTIRDLDRTVVIGNLKRHIEKEQLRVAFDVYGRISKIWLERFRQVLAFVEYVRRSDAKAAMVAMNGRRCCGCLISVDLPRNFKPQTTTEHRNERRRRRRESTSESSTSESHIESSIDAGCDSTTGRSERPCSSRQRLDCSICLHNILEKTPTSTPCGHLFCEACIKVALQRREKCPVCRQALKAENLIRMFPS